VVNTGDGEAHAVLEMLLEGWTLEQLQAMTIALWSAEASRADRDAIYIASTDRSLHILKLKATYLQRVAIERQRRAQDLVQPRERQPIDRATHIRRGIARLKELRCEGAVGAAIARAVEELERGELALDVVDRTLLDAVLCEVGPAIDRDIAADVARWRRTMREEEWVKAVARARDLAARDRWRLPDLRWDGDEAGLREVTG
jgi:hypothetical protein